MISIGFRWLGSSAKQDTAAIQTPSPRSRGAKVLWQRPSAKLASPVCQPEPISLPPGSATLGSSARQQRLWLARGEALGRVFKRLSAR